MPDVTCPECGKLFASEYLLKRHKVTHSEERLFECTVCRKTFKRRGHLKQHMQTHSGNLPFQCHECGQRFTHGERFDKHMSKHTGIAPFQCQLCGAGFVRGDRYRSHMDSHARGTARSFHCRVCFPARKWFKTQLGLDYHMADEHPGHTESEVVIKTEEIPGIGPVSSVTHTLTSPTSSLSVARITSGAGSALVTETVTSTSTSTVSTATISQSADASFPLPQQQPGTAYTGVLSVDYGKLLKKELTDFSAWRDEDEAPAFF